MPSVVGEMTKGATFDWVVDQTNVGTATLSKSSNYTVTTTDRIVLCDASGGAFTVTLYAASDNNGRIVTIKKTDASANAITIDGNGAETIDGETTKTINFQYSAIDLVCDGSNWHIV